MSDDFLSRWSRRKRAAETGPEEPETGSGPPPEAPGPEATASEAAVPEETVPEETVPEETDDEILARLGLRHPDEMERGDDFASFLRAAVPRHLKTIAYRRLWRSDPTLACLDGLNDYDGDFTGNGIPEGGLKTSYEVGRGILSRIVNLSEEVVAGPPDEADAPGEEDCDNSVREIEGGDLPQAVQAPESVQQNDTTRTTRRRMSFRTRG